MRTSLAFALGLLMLTSTACREQNGSDRVSGAANTPVASFTNGVTTGLPGLSVAFLDTSTGPVDTRSWDFGNGQTSTEVGPVIVYADPGLYTVTLTVSGARGTSSTTSTNLVQVATTPVAGFTCSAEVGFAPVLTTCTNEGSPAGGSTSFLWNFGDGTTSTDESPSHTYTTTGDFTVTQTVTNAAGSANDAQLIRSLPLEVTVTPLTGGGGPGDFAFVANSGAVPGAMFLWTVDGAAIANTSNVIIPFNSPGTFDVTFTVLSADPPLVGAISIDHVVNFGLPVAAFAPSTAEGAGPLSVTMNDASQGEITQWEWAFGDGSSCDFPTLVTSTEVCNASAPTHVYSAIGHYDVSLKVTGSAEDANDPDLTDEALQANAVTVTILDPSFEGQATAQQIAGAWTTLTPPAPAAAASHLALSSAEAAGADAGMPTDGSKWAALDGAGTDGSTGAALTNNGIETNFIRPATASVLEFDYAFLYSEPTFAGTLDAMTATVSDGTTTVEIPSARADIESPYASGSTRFPTLDASLTRVTPIHTASLDLATAFSGNDPATVYTLSIRLTNAANTFRSPRAYVDGIRFSEPADAIVAAFSVETDPLVAGESVTFTDETCIDPQQTIGCSVPTSFRWDFDTHFSIASPPATGSDEQNPTYVFPEAGDYDVTLLARNGDQESTATLTVSVIAGPVASFGATFLTSTSAPATIRFTDTSTSDGTDPIVSYSWDFAGFGVASTAGPHDITIAQAGTHRVRLTITTASGLTNTGSMDVIVD